MSTTDISSSTLLGEIMRIADAAGLSLDEHQVAAARRLVGAEAAYVHGPAGRGKTWLVDAYFAALPTTAKRRVHFHGFFGDLHRAIFRHEHDTDAAIDELLADVDVLYFDEFHVHDAGDVMLLTRLLRRLVSRGVRLIVTSNYAPRHLLPNPVFHSLAAPAIDLLEQHLEVISVEGPVDYRYATSEPRRTGFRGEWLRVAPGEPPAPEEAVELEAGGHRFTAQAVRGTRVWFRFAELCEADTSVHDFVEWADRFDDWVLEGVPALAQTTRAARQRFGNLVDVLCDRGHRLTVIADVDRDELAVGEGMPVDIGRTLSRLAMLGSPSPLGR
ncbi:cell division protein ZapE [Salinibacterium sp. ZJ450]|uniref:cell division protein ZapE n=1 Tax=Salinibacterium sp. ZJ450 TaxID=2708338 RepID=UPI00141DBCF5|nr:cell division protein ZapE [Salinibacterium sp. ZJ450]